MSGIPEVASAEQRAAVEPSGRLGTVGLRVAGRGETSDPATDEPA